MQFVEAGRITLHFSHRRTESRRPPIVFINSLGTDLRIWDAVADDLAADFPVLLYDKRGHGLSDLGAPALLHRRSRRRSRTR